MSLKRPFLEEIGVQPGDTLIYKLRHSYLLRCGTIEKLLIDIEGGSRQLYYVVLHPDRSEPVLVYPPQVIGVFIEREDWH